MEDVWNSIKQYFSLDIGSGGQAELELSALSMQLQFGLRHLINHHDLSPHASEEWGESSC